jgi:hypothetical protein
MGAAAYNRGSKLVRREADERAREAISRADRDAYKAEAARLRDRVITLERDLARARRCIAELRRSKDARMSDARDEQSRSDAAIRILARIAFGERGT